MIEKWRYRAEKFILEQRKKELERAILRYPSSAHYCSRKSELTEIEDKLNKLEEEYVSS